MLNQPSTPQPDIPLKLLGRKVRTNHVNRIGADAITPQRSNSAARWGLLTV